MARRLSCLLLTLAAACGGKGGDATAPDTTGNGGGTVVVLTCRTVGPATGRVPLTELTDRTYLGLYGGLYPSCQNTAPRAHDSVGVARARSVQPLDGNGNPSPDGKIVLLSIGMSNTTQEFCSASSLPPCNAWTFMGQAAADTTVNHTTLVIVNGARGGQSADTWLTATAPNYDRIRDTWLTPNGLTERQVQVAWVKVADRGPTVSLPDSAADAYVLKARMGSIVRALRTRYPSLRQVFFSSRIYGGYGIGLNPEPYAYESGFAVKWLIEAQIAQMGTGGVVVDALAGDLNSDTGAPWLAWGAYLWADGTNPRADGLTWQRADIESDGVHPAQSGETKVGGMLLAFFKSSPYTKCWFVVGGSCP